MRRRAFLSGALGIFVAPLVARAQPAGKVHQVGWLSGGGNITAPDIAERRFERQAMQLFKEMVPGLSRTAVVWDPTNPWHPTGVKRLETAARALGVRLQTVGVRTPGEIDAAFVARHHLPTMNGLIEYTEAGGLASYWPNSAEMFRRAAGYVHRIPSGSRPSDLATEQPTRFEFVINLRTAKTLGSHDRAIGPPARRSSDRLTRHRLGGRCVSVRESVGLPGKAAYPSG